MGAVQSFGQVLPTLTGTLGTVQTLASTVNTLQTLSNSKTEASQQLALEQLEARQKLQEQQLAAQTTLDKQNIAQTAAGNEADRVSALKRAVASQRAQYGSSGVSASGGSSEAVLLGLFEESEAEKSKREASNVLKLKALDQSLTDNQALNLLQATQLAERQKISNLF